MINVDWIARHRWWVIGVALTAVVIAALGAARLQQTADYRIYFNPDDPQLLASESLQATYTRSDNVLFVITPKDGQVFTRHTLAGVQRLTEAAWQLPYSLRVDSVTNYQHTYADADTLVVADLVADPGALSDADLQRIRDIAVGEPSLVRRLIAPDARVTGVNVTVQLPNVNPDQETREVALAAREMARKIAATDTNLELNVTGIVMMNNAFPEASERDMGTLIPVMFLIVIVGLWLLLRSATATFATVTVLLLSIVAAMGLAGWLGIKLSPASSSAPIIILTVAVADCVHIFGTLLHLMRYQGMEKHAAMVEAVRVNLQPVLLTSLTTAIGFLSMNFSDSPPFHDLGNITAIGVVAAGVLTLSFLPALVAVLPLRVASERLPEQGLLMPRFADAVVRRKKALLWSVGLISLALLACVPRNELNDEFVKYFDTSIDVRQATDYATEHLTGVTLIEYSLPGAGEGGVAEPDYLRQLQAFAEWYRVQPEVKHVNVLSDVIQRLNKNMHGDQATYYRLPESRDLAAQYLLLYEMSLPFGLDLNNQVNLDKSASRMTVLLDSLSNDALLALEQRARSWQHANLPAAMQAPGIGWSIMFGHIAERNIDSMLKGTALAALLISLTLIVAFRSVKLGLLSMLPNMLPALLAFGLWGLLVGRIGLAASVITAMTLGIVVDDTIHMLSKYLRGRREHGYSPEDAIRYAFSIAGRAMVVSSVVLCAGFLVLAFSTFQVNAVIGLLAAITTVLALVLDFLWLPPLLMALARRGTRVLQAAASVA